MIIYFKSDKFGYCKISCNCKTIKNVVLLLLPNSKETRRKMVGLNEFEITLLHTLKTKSNKLRPSSTVYIG